MKLNQFYIDGAWTAPHGADEHEIINPANGKTLGTLRLGNNEDVDKAVAAAKTAFKSFQHTTVDDRLELLNRVLDVFKSRYDDFVLAITQEMGAQLRFRAMLKPTAALTILKQRSAPSKISVFLRPKMDMCCAMNPLGCAV